MPPLRNFFERADVATYLEEKLGYSLTMGRIGQKKQKHKSWEDVQTLKPPADK
jgi:hypothetical protein